MVTLRVVLGDVMVAGRSWCPGSGKRCRMVIFSEPMGRPWRAGAGLAGVL